MTMPLSARRALAVLAVGAICALTALWVAAGRPVPGLHSTVIVPIPAQKVEFSPAALAVRAAATNPPSHSRQVRVGGQLVTVTRHANTLSACQLSRCARLNLRARRLETWSQ